LVLAGWPCGTQRRAVLSAGFLVFRGDGAPLEVLLVHPGGPFWARRDEGAWSIPKGEVQSGEEPLQAAEREFAEELGLAVPGGARLALGEVRQAGSKRVVAWGVQGDLSVADVRPGTFEMEWPPRSGRIGVFPEVDRADWFELDVARTKLNRAQVRFLDRLVELRRGPPRPR
jgi:predicted NUDIX family NTP pyrophosphohydrolase